MAVAATEEVVIELDGKTTTASTARATPCCRRRARRPAGAVVVRDRFVRNVYGAILAGSARMVNNDALEDDEVAEGWVLTCQALPTSRTVHVVYE